MPASSIGVKDNDWVEVYNDHGVYCTRACVSARIPKVFVLFITLLREHILFLNLRERGEEEPVVTIVLHAYT
jgi:nitrate reductase alpha subunit